MQGGTVRRKTARQAGDPVSPSNPHSSPPSLTVPPPPPECASSPSKPLGVATVKRNYCGTRPFDRHWLNVDCCGLVCALLTYGLHLYGVYTVCTILLPPWMSNSSNSTASSTTESSMTTMTDATTAAPLTTPLLSDRHLTLWGHVHTWTFLTLALLAMVSHFKAMTTDPGAVPPDARPLEDVQDVESSSSKRGRLCRRCHAYKPPRAHHCSVCKRCIIKMDHHCPWVNNCVGIGNHKYFLLFCFYTCLCCFYSLALVVTRFVVCMHSDHAHYSKGSMHRHHHVHCFDEPSHLLNILGLVVESLLFGMFTSCMMCDQWDVVWSNVTHIDRLKGAFGGNESDPEAVPGVLEVFGTGRSQTKRSHKFRPDWLSPLHRVCFPSPVMQDKVFGYCRPTTNQKRLESQESLLELGTTTTTTPDGTSGSGDNGTTSSGTTRLVRSVAEIV